VNETSSDRRDLGLTSPPAGWCAERAPIQVVTREIARSHLTPGVWSAVARDVAPDRSHRIARPARPRRSKNWSLHRPVRCERHSASSTRAGDVSHSHDEC
jgi:hypothetical protein